jgi:hypothetical protein
MHSYMRTKHKTYVYDGGLQLIIIFNRRLDQALQRVILAVDGKGVNPYILSIYILGRNPHMSLGLVPSCFLLVKALYVSKTPFTR